MTRPRLVLLAALGATALGGCSLWAPPQPWEKGDLARPAMRLDADPLQARFESHTYFSKEAASGGGGVGGGGCGCN
ncbi:DUF4266 domain-containing protein [Ideonella livida]|uniref:DUF4266 domain-containing protein n=1 Tax=Ideonella livida TaxID=2707176 RepID=A0A7C9PJG0_9BURK|nr:DUF4266 domain-containing protein [Ideonella livida]NDY93496.1 DUF4266 domain-containing protein [Ideonella livida]